MNPVLASIPALLLGAGALGALLLDRRPALASGAGAGAAVLAGAVGLVGAGWDLWSHDAASTALPWFPPLGLLRLGVDPLSAWFAVPVFALGALGALYGSSYLRRYHGHKSMGAAWFCYDLLLAGMATLLVARSGLLFLVGWEAMSLAAWGLVTFEHEHAHVRRAGFAYLVATHLGLAALLVLFAELSPAADLAMVRPAPALVGFALVGFGAKAGLVPFHVWLPDAHAAAPSHVSALLSGAMVKMGIYGLLRVVVSAGGPPAWLGPVLGVTGLAGAVLGAGLALSQRDIKRVLAYSTIENVGLIALGLGVGFTGASLGAPRVAALGVAGALIHVWNHAAAKGLLFFGAGSILHGSGTKDLEQLGGLAGRMPWTAGLVVLGALAIGALPPLNGFLGEWLMYRAMLEGGQRPGTAGLALLAGVAGLAFVGALVCAAFARLVGIALLGEPRSEAAAHAHEPRALLLPMAALAGTCVAMGLVPAAALSLARPVVAAVSGAPADPAFEGTTALGLVSAGLWLAVGAGALLTSRIRARVSSTWGCGYTAGTRRLQYTGRGFAELGADYLLPRWLRPPADVVPPIEAVFPPPARLEVRYPDPLLEGLYLPLFASWARRLAALRALQHGRTHLYLAYMGMAVVLALAWATWWSV